MRWLCLSGDILAYDVSYKCWWNLKAATIRYKMYIASVFGRQHCSNVVDRMSNDRAPVLFMYESKWVEVERDTLLRTFKTRNGYVKRGLGMDIQITDTKMYLSLSNIVLIYMSCLIQCIGIVKLNTSIYMIYHIYHTYVCLSLSAARCLWCYLGFIWPIQCHFLYMADHANNKR